MMDFVSWDDEIPNIESHKIRSKPPSFGCSWMSQKRPTELITVVPHFTIFTMQRPKWNSGRGFFKPADQLPTGLGCRFVVQKPFSWERDFPFTSIILNCITNQSFPGFWTSLMWHNNCWKKIIPQRVMHDQIPLIFWSKHQLVVGSERVAVGSWIHGVNFILAKTPQSTGKNDRHHSSTWGVGEAFFCLDLPSVISWQQQVVAMLNYFACVFSWSPQELFKINTTPRKKKHGLSSSSRTQLCWLVVSTYPSEKWWSSSVGIINYSQYMEK